MTSQPVNGSNDGLLESFLRDLRYAARRLRNNWGFTALAVLTLALGIGATTAVFSVVNGVLLRPLPYPESGQIMTIGERTKSGGEMHVANPNFTDIQNQSHSFDAIAFFGAWPTTILGGTEPVLADAAHVSTQFFSVFRVKPLMGRTFTRDETEPGGSPTAVVSSSYWRAHLGSTPNIGDRSLTIGGQVYPIVGVMPDGFNFPDATDVWVATPMDLGPTRTAHNLQVVARLRPGVSIDHARTDLDLIYSRLKSQFGKGMDAYGFTIDTLHDKLVGSVQRPLLLLLGAAALVLLVACTNVASTVLAAGAARRGEIAIRAALGAKRARVLRQLTTEGLLLAMLGAAVGLALAAFVLRLMLSLAPDGALPQVGSVGLDGSVVAFAIVTGILAAVLSSVFPALRTSQASISHELVTRGDVGGRSRVWGTLVATEVAMALLLLVGCGLLVRSFAKVISIDPGFKGAGVLTASLALPETTYPDSNSIAAFYQQLLPEVDKLAGVQQAGITNNVPLTDQGYDGGFEIEGAPPPPSYTNYGIATSGYFRALSIPVKRGRLFDNRDRAGVPDVALVNQAFVDKFLPGTGGVGIRVRNLANDRNWYGADRWITIVGVVGDVRDASLTAPTPPTIYVNPYQRPMRARYTSLVLRSSVAPQSLIGPVGALLKQRGVPAKFQTMDSILSGSVAARRFSTSVLSFFAGIALILAAIGIYGVVSYQVVQRTREIGIRMALGAQPTQVRSLIVRNSMRVVGLGLIVGILATPLLTRVLQTLLFGISPTDPGTLLIVLVLFGIVAIVASLIPAHRATRVDPVLALRSE
jgi:putative ABC transport system permease protein